MICIVSCRQSSTRNNTNTDESGFDIRFDTVRINIEKLYNESPCASKEEYGHLLENVELQKVCRYQGNYLLNFDSEMIKLSADLKDYCTFPISEFDVLQELYVRNDSLIVLSARDRSDGIVYFWECFNNEKSCWEELPEKIKHPLLTFAKIYQDDDYSVSYSNRGEFGTYLLFYDNSSHEEYIFQCQVNRILRCNDVYYIIGNNSVLKIDNPKKGLVHDGTLYEKPQYSISRFDEKSYEVVLQDENSLFCSGFLLDKQLYVVGTSENRIYIDRLEDERKKRVLSIEAKFRTRDDCPFGLDANELPDYILLASAIHEANDFGSFLEINEYKIRLVTFCFCR